MELKTSGFGVISYSEEDIVQFNAGLYGFESNKSFLYIPSEDSQFQFSWLQSIDDPDLVFIVTDPFLFVENYDFNLDEDVVDQLKVEKPEELCILSIVNIGEEVEKTTVNIKAPIVINIGTKVGRQVILTEEYPYKYYIFNKELNEGK
ncbi:MAG: flagellar assembly protein FliW [Clostridia bacterium]|nr:flagellar assembly protein FliW [Clostridia bacterium]